MNSVSKIDIDDKEEVQKMPYCAEKLLITLMIEFSQSVDKNFLIGKIDKLKERLELEGIYSYEVDQLYKDISSMLDRNLITEAYESLKGIHKLLRDLNIPKLLRLTQENKNALNLVDGKKIFLFMGFSGTGKLFY